MKLVTNYSSENQGDHITSTSPHFINLCHIKSSLVQDVNFSHLLLWFASLSEILSSSDDNNKLPDWSEVLNLG